MRGKPRPTRQEESEQWSGGCFPVSQGTCELWNDPPSTCRALRTRTAPARVGQQGQWLCALGASEQVTTMSSLGRQTRQQRASALPSPTAMHAGPKHISTPSFPLPVQLCIPPRGWTSVLSFTPTAKDSFKYRHQGAWWAGWRCPRKPSSGPLCEGTRRHQPSSWTPLTSWTYSSASCANG